MEAGHRALWQPLFLHGKVPPDPGLAIFSVCIMQSFLFVLCAGLSLCYVEMCVCVMCSL